MVLHFACDHLRLAAAEAQRYIGRLAALGLRVLAAQSYRIKPEPKPDAILNVKFIFDGETGKLKKAEVIDEA